MISRLYDFRTLPTFQYTFKQASLAVIQAYRIHEFSNVFLTNATLQMTCDAAHH
jgi:hypothetical protein